MPITPHIVVQGAERAAAFYRDAFGAEELSRIPTPDGRLMSVQLRIGDGMPAPRRRVPRDGRARAAVDRRHGGRPRARRRRRRGGVRAGGRGRSRACASPVQEMFWGDLHGQLDDPFGHRWNVAPAPARRAPRRGRRRGGAAVLLESRLTRTPKTPPLRSSRGPGGSHPFGVRGVQRPRHRRRARAVRAGRRLAERLGGRPRPRARRGARLLDAPVGGDRSARHPHRLRDAGRRQPRGRRAPARARPGRHAHRRERRPPRLRVPR